MPELTALAYWDIWVGEDLEVYARGGPGPDTQLLKLDQATNQFEPVVIPVTDDLHTWLEQLRPEK